MTVSGRDQMTQRGCNTSLGSGNPYTGWSKKTRPLCILPNI